jgi:peptidoglycan/xylan/chitin deacetylase (PgdA/CDA1 family)
MMRTLVKRAVELGVTTAGAAAVARRLNRGRVAILAYHNVVPDEEAGHGDSSLHMPLSRFRTQLDRLERTHRVVSLQRALAGIPDGGPYAVITFDDAYRGAVTLALPELRRRALPATVFVAPALLGEAGLWWDELGEAGRLTPGVRREAMLGHRGRLDGVRAWAFPDGARPELRDHVGEGIGVGGHAWDHACLPALDPDDLAADLRRTVSWLDDAAPAPVPWLALPYGEGNEAVTRAALEAGFEGVLRISGGLCSHDPDAASLPRINVPAGLSARGLELRTSGMVR